MKNKQSFTLVEMLVVIVVIFILMGIVLKLQSLVGAKTATASSFARMENIKACLEEYYRVYGEYPPQAANVGSYSTYYQSGEEGEKPDNWLDIKAAGQNADPSFNMSVDTGLVYHLQAAGSSFRNPHWERWHEYFQGAGYHAWRVAHTNERVPDWGQADFTNMVYYLLDAWDRQFMYRCEPPYQSYEVFSSGPDGAPDTEDDLGRESM